MVRSIEQLVNEQVKRWHIESRERRTTKPPKRAPPLAIAVSNAYGSNGVPTAHRIGELTGFKVFDREIVEHIANDAKVRIETVETLDERAQSWIDDFITGLFRERAFYQDQYARTLTRTIASLWHHGPCVMVGHGCCHVLPRSHSLAVRITASPTRRALRVQNLEDITTLDQARKRIERVDAERDAFNQKFFTARVEDPLNYDMILNTDRLTTDQAARAVVDVFERRFPGGLEKSEDVGGAAERAPSYVSDPAARHAP